MTGTLTTDHLVLGGALALLALRRLPGRQAARLRGWLATAARLGFLVWLYQVTDGAAFSPFSFTQAFLGGTMWQPVLTVFGLLQVLTRAYRTTRGPAVARKTVPLPVSSTGRPAGTNTA